MFYRCRCPAHSQAYSHTHNRGKIFIQYYIYFYSDISLNKITIICECVSYVYFLQVRLIYVNAKQTTHLK